jgi:plasmid stabilization system protein ParE
VRVRFTSEARNDLREIGYFIRQDNPTRSVTFVRELRDRCFGLASAPLRYPLVVGPGSSDIRRAVHGNYGIFYIVEEDEVRIVRILHHARDSERLLFPDD